MTNGEFGDLRPREIIQKDTRACLSACILSQVEPGSGLSEEDITRVLTADGLYEEGLGTGLYPACVLDMSLGKVGLRASPVYDARGISDNEEPRVYERLSLIDNAVRNGSKVVVAYPKRREGEAPFLHYSVISGFRENEEGNGVVIRDPSDVDGGTKHPTWQQLQEYVTPTDGIPVMAWGIDKASVVPAGCPGESIIEPGLPGFDLLENPLCHANDNGKAIPPGTRHPISVAMTTIELTRHFSEYGDIVLSRDGRYPFGYPRFVVPPTVKSLASLSMGSSTYLPFPSQNAARSASYLDNTYGKGTKMVEKEGLFWLPSTNLNAKAWQHTGLGISSRQAAAVLEGRPHNDIERREVAEAKIKSVIEFHTGAHPEDIYLFPTGMAAIHWLNKALIKISGEEPGIQFGFPYTDTYEQRKYGPERNAAKNILDFREGDEGDYERLKHDIDSGLRIRGLITEYPSNPLLWTPDLERLDGILDGKAPIILDDTIGTIVNLDDSKLPPSVVARVTALAKFFSSVGDVMGGSIVLRPESPQYNRLKEILRTMHEDTLWYEDAEVLASNSDLFPGIMPVINQNTEELAGWLDEEWTGEGKTLAAVYHPSLLERSVYDKAKKSEGGYGGLMSLRFRNPNQAYPFLDKLRVTKGPSLGTFYTLASPYTWLAHKPVESVSKFGVVPDLIRLSIGIEPIEELQSRIQEALIASGK